jgi:ligand-binding sensor domain-containing protein
MKNKNTHQHYFWAVLALILMTNLVSAQEKWTSKNRKNSDLTYDVVTTLFKDSKGAIWAGTPKGLNKFENDKCTNFLQANDMKLYQISGITEDLQSNIWISTLKKGVVKYDGSNWTVYNSKNGLCNSKVLSAFTDKKGNVWIGTRKGLNKFDGKTWTTYTMKDGLVNNAVLTSFEDKNGNIWFGTGNGVSKFDGTNWVNYTQKDGLARKLVWSIKEDAGGNMWFGTYTGKFSKFDGVKWETLKKGSGYFNGMLVVYGLCEGVVFTLLLGPVYGGIFLVTNVIFAAVPSAADATRVYIDSNDNLWLSAMPKGVFKYDGNNWMQYSKNNGLADKRVFSMTEDNDGNMWFGTGRGISILYK